MPALFTTVDATEGPTAWPISRTAPSRVAIESVFATAEPPAARISRTTASAGPVSLPSPLSEAPMSLTTTHAPAAASCSAMSRPMPPPAPVTTATLLRIDLLIDSPRLMLEKRRGHGR
jgi:hypothetical protein